MKNAYKILIGNL